MRVDDNEALRHGAHLIYKQKDTLRIEMVEDSTTYDDVEVPKFFAGNISHIVANEGQVRKAKAALYKLSLHNIRFTYFDPDRVGAS